MGDDGAMRGASSGLAVQLQRRMPAFCGTVIGGLIAVFVGIPLTSPDDRIGNTGSVAILSLFAALILGRIWAGLSGDVAERGRKYYWVCTGMFATAGVSALFLEVFMDFSNTVRYVLPMSAAVSVASAILTPIIERGLRGSALLWFSISLAIALLGFGVILAYFEVGFTEARSLSLPPPP